jgi:hypothetical protein
MCTTTATVKKETERDFNGLLGWYEHGTGVQIESNDSWNSKHICLLHSQEETSKQTTSPSAISTSIFKQNHEYHFKPKAKWKQ